MNTVSFTFPSFYTIPDSFKSIDPYVLCHVFDCMDVILSKLNIRDKDTVASMKYKYEKEIETMSALFLKRLEDQTKQLLDERNGAIECAKEQLHKEMSVSMILQESEKQRLINDYE